MRISDWSSDVCSSDLIDMDDVGRETVLSAIALGGRLSTVVESALGIQVPGVVFREVHETHGHLRIGFSGSWREDNEKAVLRRFLERTRVDEGTSVSGRVVLGGQRILKKTRMIK